MPSNVFSRGESFCARLTVDGEQIWLGSHATREEAEAAVARGRAGDLPERETVTAWCARWTGIAQRRRKRNVETVRHTLQMAMPFVREFGTRELEDVARDECVAWAMRHPGSLRYARTILSDAVWAGACSENVLSGIAVRQDELEVDPPTREDVMRLADADPVLRSMVLVGAFSGLRLSELAMVDARDLGVGTRRLRVPCGKGEKPRTVVVFEPGLSALRHEARFGRVFSRPSGIAWDRKAVNKRWVKTRAALGLPDVRFHDLRHFHATWLLDQGVSDLDVAVQLGHFDAQGRPNPELVRRRYGHPDHGAALERVAAVAS